VIMRCYGPYLALIVLVGGALLMSGWMVFYAPFLLIESLSTSALLFAAAGLIGSVRRPCFGMFLLAGAGLALSVFAKSTGLPVAISAALIVRFLPRGVRMRALSVVVAPALVIYLLMSAHMFRREGVFMPEALLGLALSGDVFWMLSGDVPEESGLINSLKDNVSIITTGMPRVENISTWAQLDDYVDFTLNVWNEVAFGRIAPTLRRFDPNIKGRVETNSLLLHIALVSIAANPLSYVLHVATHVYGMWRQIGKSWIDLRDGAIGLRSHYNVNTREGFFITLLGEPLAAAGDARTATRLQGTIRLASADALDYVAPRVRYYFWPLVEPMKEWSQFRAYLSIFVGVISIAVCALFFVPGSLSFEYRAEFTLAIMINAYILAYALLSPAVDRYASTIMPVVFVFTLCFARTTLRMVAIGAADIYVSRALAAAYSRD
jgi:hypothetical protein